MKITDCTIRDGGHLNKWCFDPLCVKAAYYAALKGGVDYFEIGYRFPESKKDLGPFGYCTDTFLNSLLEINEKCKLIVMIDAGKSDGVYFENCTPEKTLIKGVRVASYPYEYTKAISVLEKIADKGYEVFLNLMASSEISEDQFLILKNWKNKDILQVVNFADSFGSYTPSNIPFHINKLKSIGFEKIGFHSHNNLQMAFANSLKAIEEGATHIDASILGMGRGSGNLPVEIFLGYLEKEGHPKYNTVPYLDVIERFFNDLFNKYNWGYKLQSLVGGLKNIHPYYIDELFAKKSYTIEEIWNAADFIKENCPTSFSIEELNLALGKRFYKPLTPEKVNETISQISEQIKIVPAFDAFKVNDFELKDRHKGKKFLIIANGPSILTYDKEIKQLIKNENLITIGVNFLKDIFVPDYHVFVSRKRLFKYINSINKASTLLIPSFFGKEILVENYEGKYNYFDVEIISKDSATVINGTTQKNVHLNVSVSAILLAYLMGASEIYSVGIDGYIDENSKKMVFFYNENDTPDDKEVASFRYEMFVEELDRIDKFLQKNSVSFSILTPTSHKKYYRKYLGI
jgi:4-hydroxy 2-oxovalerate aldolase